MKILVIAAMLFSFSPLQASAGASEGKIWLMQSYDFNFLQHKKAKNNYVDTLNLLFHKMRLQIGTYDYRTTSDEELFQMITTNATWDEVIVVEIEKRCRNPQNLKICKALMDARNQTFDYIKLYPETDGN